MIELTEHAKNRIKERCGGKGSNILSIATAAYFKGKTLDNCEKRMYKYLKKVLGHSQGNQIKIWSNTIFIFKNTTLITVYPISNKILTVNDRRKRFYGKDI